MSDVELEASHPSSLLCTVDAVLLTLRSQTLQVVLWRRDREPGRGRWALPGGYVHPQEDWDTAAAADRVLRQKTGIQVPYLEQLASFSGARRDPRGWSISVAYFALVPFMQLPFAVQSQVAADADRGGTACWDVAALPSLAFDHADIVKAALDRLRTKSQYSSLPVHLCGETFTLPALQSVYEVVLGEPLNKVSFRRKVEELGMLEPVVGAMSQGGAHRPAQLYRLRPEFRDALSLLDRGL